MEKGLKIVTIGGGSSYTPELMEGFIKRYNELPIKEIWLVDIEQGKEKVNIDAEMSQRMWDAAGYDVKVHVSFDRREALKDADFVTTQFRVGLLEARIKDERIPLSYGMLGQETNGAGGIFKAFRTIPVILDIVEDMKELCPNAWLINFTNPSGMVTEAVIKYGKWDRCIGLCNVPTIAMMKEPIALNVDPNELIYQFVGLNHFHWHKVYDKDGKHEFQHETEDVYTYLMPQQNGDTYYRYIFTPFDDDYQTIEGHFYVYGDTRFGSLNLSDSGRIKYIKKSYRTVKAPKDMEILTYWEVKFYTAKNWTTYEPFQSDENYNYYKIPDGMNVVMRQEGKVTRLGWKGEWNEDKTIYSFRTRGQSKPDS